MDRYQRAWIPRPSKAGPRALVLELGRWQVRAKPVTHTMDCFDASARRSQFVSDPFDVNINRSGLNFCRESPNIVKECASLLDAIFPLYQSA